jgi:hypothetical protein
MRVMINSLAGSVMVLLEKKGPFTKVLSYLSKKHKTKLLHSIDYPRKVEVFDKKLKLVGTYSVIEHPNKKDFAIFDYESGKKVYTTEKH